MDDLISVIIFAAVILLSTVFGGKKKKARGNPPQAPKAPRPRPGVASATQASSREQPRHVVRDERPRLEPGKEPGSFREFFELLQQQAETATRGEPLVLEEAPEPPPQPTAPVRRERPPAETLETLEAAGGKSHDRFHDKYIRPLGAPPRNLPPRFILPQDPVSLKRAVIWSEILGSPKGLE